MSQTLAASPRLPMKSIAPRQLAALFASNLVPPMIGGFLMPLLAVYLDRLGINPAFTGFYLATAFFMLALGSVSSGWLSQHIQHRRRVFMVAALIQIPCLVLMGQVSQFIPLTVFTGITFFCGGTIIGTILILAGESAQSHERGRVYGILGMCGGLGTAIGGFAGGAIVDWRGFPTMFAVSGAIVIFQIIAAFFVDDTRPTDNTAGIDADEAVATTLNIMTATMWFLFAANLMAHIASLGTAMSRPLGMDGLGFSATAVSSTNAIAGLISVPVPFLVGVLSDKVGRKPMLVLIYGAVFAGTVVLVSANLLWHFWVAAVLNAMLPAGVGVGSALINDLVPKRALSSAISRYTAMPWLGGTVGFIATGLVLQATDLFTVYIIAAIAAGLAAMLIFPIRAPQTQQ